MTTYANILSDGIGFADPATVQYEHTTVIWTFIIPQVLGVRGVPDGQQVTVSIATLEIAASPVGLLDAQTGAGDGFGFGAIPEIAFRMLLAAAVGFGATPTAFRAFAAEMVATLTLVAGPGSTLDARDTVAQALPMHAASALAWPAAMSAALALGDSTGHGMAAAQHVVDGMLVHAVPASHVEFGILLDEGVALADGPRTTADLISHIADGLGLLATVRLPDGTVYTAWVLHGDTLAYSQYLNYPFNSFCELDGKYYGATDTGLYLLEGDDDAGTPIAARLRSGLGDIGTGRLKRMDAMYVGYRADGGLLLKVVTTSDGGSKREDWYALAAQTANEVREGRVKIGRGLKSRYWGFELTNVNGGDFALDTIAWHPLLLERRI